MATYDIDKITLPSGDVCNLREPYNMVINGGPEFATLWGGSPGYPTGIGGLGWSLTNTGTSGAAYPFDTTYSDTTSYLKKNDIQLKFRTSDDTKFVQLQHIICNTAWMGAVDLTPLKDNDTITIAFDYKSDSQLFLKIRFDIKETSDSAPVVIADYGDSADRKTLAAQTDWVRVSYTYTVPSGVTALVQKIPNLYQSYFVLQIYPTLAESYAHFRNFSICKGSNISYIPNDGSGCFISVRSNYYTGTTSAFSRFNAGNVSGYTGDYYFPTTSIKATNGAWSQGVTSSDDVYKFVYISDQSFTDNKNYAERFCLPATTGEDASYNIITTKNPNDVPSEVTEGNLVINGGPIVSFHTGSQQYSPANWACFTGSPSLLTTWSTDNMQFEFDITAASSSDNNYFQLQKVLSRETTHPGYFGGVKCEDFQDGEKVTLSFEYISPYTLKYVPRLYIKPTSTSETYNCFASSNTDNPVTLAATNTWSRVSYTGTVSDGWSSAINTLLEQKYANSFYFIISFCPQGTGAMKIRNIQINRGEVATKYTHNPLDYLFNVGSGANYLGSREGAIIKNNGNFTATGEGQIYPIIGGKSQTGFWSNGTCADKYQFVYLTDANYTARNNYAEVYSLPAPDASISEIKYYDILTTKNVTVDEWTKNDFSISNLTTASSNIYGTTIYITGVCDITVLNLSGPISGSWSWGTEKTIFTINSSLSSSNPKKYNAFYGGSAQAAASYGTNGSATFYKHGNGTTIGCSISANPASGQYVQGQIVLVHLYS